MSQVFAYATPLLPYQAAPIVVAAGMAKVPAGAAVKMCLLVGLISFVVLAPLYLLWFKLARLDRLRHARFDPGTGAAPD